MRYKRGMGMRLPAKENAVEWALFCVAFSSVAFVALITVFLFVEGAGAFFADPIGFVGGSVWDPTGATESYGSLPLIVGSLFVTGLAILFAVPVGLGCAIFIAEILPKNARRFVKPAVELLAGIPSVIYGFFGLVLLTEWLRVTFDKPSGESWLAGSILLGIMALPTIVSVSEDALNSVPREHKEGSLALGSTRWQAIWRVAIPCAMPGIAAAVVLGIGRAIGETMAVMMVTGNSPIIPNPLFDVFSPVRTITGTLAIEMGEVPRGSEHYHALFGLAIILFFIVIIINTAAQKITTHLRDRVSGTSVNRQNGNGNKNGALKKSNYHIFDERIKKIATYSLIIVFCIAMFYALGWALAGTIALVGIAGYFASRKMSARSSEKAAFGLISASGIFVIVLLAMLLFYIFSNGLGALSWDFLTQAPRRTGRSGGIFPAIVGTLMLVGVSIGFAIPLGVGSGIYLAEYTHEGRLTKLIRAGVDNLNGTPSIVFGLFGFAFFVLYLNFGISLIAGGLTLGMMILPTIIRTTEEAIRAVPQSLREGSLALGATKWTTIRKVVLPSALPGIATGSILGVGRAAGETAPIMFTAVVFSQRFLPNDPMDPVMALPYHLFVLATNVPGAVSNAYGTAVVLLSIVLGINIVAIVLREKYQKYARW